MEEKKRTLEDWQNILGSERKLTKEEYEKILKNKERLEKIKNLLTEGKGFLSNIAKNAGSVASKVVQRMVENYDSAIGTPRYGTSIREVLGYADKLNPVKQLPYQYTQYRNMGSPYTYNVPFINGPQYPRELFNVNPSVLNNALGIQKETAILRPPIITSPSLQMIPQPLQVTPPPQVTPISIPMTNEPQVVFLFDDKTDTISEVMNEFPTVQQAELEASKLRKQGLPAFYASKGEYVNRVRVKA